MPKKGDRHKDIYFEDFVAAGGQGEVFLAKVSGSPMALKLFYEQYSEPSDEERLRWLAGQRLWTLSTLLAAAPQRIERIGGRLAHLSAFVSGSSLEEEMERAHKAGTPPWSLPQGLLIAASIAKGVAICEDLGIALGDIAASNLTVVRKGGHFEIYLLDMDNYAAPGQPPPRMLGQLLYLAPELQAGATRPTKKSDLYALGVLIHEILLLVHPKAGRDSCPEEFLQAVAEGRWHQDPSYPRTHRAGAGYPAEALSPTFHRLFRQAQSTDPSTRPEARAWVQALWEVLDEARRGPGTYQCDHCSGFFVNDVSKDRCPFCGASPPVLGLEIAGRTFPFTGSSQCLGRLEAGGSNSVSHRHLVVRRAGHEYFIEDISSSGTWRRRNGSWMRLPPRTPVPVGPGEELKLGDTKGRVVKVK